MDTLRSVFQLLVLSLACIHLGSTPGIAQIQGMVPLGDTMLLSWYSCTPPACQGKGPCSTCGCGFDGSDSGTNAIFVALTYNNHSNAPIFFAPSSEGSVTSKFGIIGGCNCNWCYPQNSYYALYVEGTGVSDSFAKIRPLPQSLGGYAGWPITMTPDSGSQFWSCKSAPTFDNPIPDTTTFSEFSAVAPNGSNCTLQVFDSTTSISQYRELPFRRKHALNFKFFSSNYKAFDTVIFSCRMRHGEVDSIISYPLPVTWVARASVAEGQSPSPDYALPNPFTARTTIGFTLAKAEPVKL